MKSIDDKFWSRVDVRSEEDCWVWMGSKAEKGYGRFRHNKSNVSAHRYSAKLKYGELPEGMFVCHKCDNPPCVNPNHLFLGTPKDNAQDMAAKGRGVKHAHERNPRAKLKWEQIKAIRESKLSDSELAAQYNVSRPSIFDIRKNITWVEKP